MAQDNKQNQPDAWLASLVAGLAATSTMAIAIIILFFFHTR
ncbi:MAG: hypothetical protein WBQ34_13605 [Candidatus Acidiferrales bacterium]